MTAQSTCRIYVADLAAYNAGILHGQWIDANQDADDIRAEIADMLRKSPCPNVVVECPRCAADITVPAGEGADDCPVCKGTNEVPSAEEWAIHDYEGFEGIKLSEHEDIDTVAELAAAVEEHGEPFAIWWNNESRSGADVERFEEQYRGTFDSEEDWAAEWLEETGFFLEIPKPIRETVKMYFDYEAWARDARLNGDVWFHQSGGEVFVFDNH